MGGVYFYVSMLLFKDVGFHTLDVWNESQHIGWTGWMAGMEIHWYNLTTSLHRLVQIILPSNHATPAVSAQASLVTVINQV